MSGEPGEPLGQLDLSRLNEAPAGHIGSVIWHFASLGSTNTLLKRLVARGQASDGTVVVADEQLEGRGRLGRVWISRPGAGLFVSIYVPSSTQVPLSCTAALAAQAAIADVAGLRPSLKWPNDILVSHRKLGGVLVERSAEGAVVGVGINTNAQQPDLDRISPDSTSILMATGGRVDHTRLLDCLLRRLQEQSDRSAQAPHEVFEEWRERLETLGQMVEVETSRETWIGRAVDVAEDGSLLVTNDKRLVRVYAADVKLRPGRQAAP